MRYLAAKYQVPDHWYPSKLEDRARVDECLEWTDSNMRAGAAGYFFNKVAIKLYYTYFLPKWYCLHLIFIRHL